MSKKQIFEESEGFMEKKKYITKELIKSVISSALIIGGIVGTIIAFMIPIAISENFTYPSIVWNIFGIVTVALWILPIILNYFYNRVYARNFRYTISKKFIVIRSGVFTKTKNTIPFSRIQNINITQGIFDRMFDIYTVKIETAGSSGVANASNSGKVKPEGYIPGVADPSELENIINSLVHQYTQNIPETIQGRVIDNPDLVFDQFTAYFLEKLQEGGDMKNNIEKLRKDRNLGVQELADRLGVSRQTIYNLEAGKFLPSLKLAMLVAKEFNVEVEKIFELESKDEPKNS